MTKIYVKYQNNWHKTVGGVAHTRYLISIYNLVGKMTSSTCVKKSDKDNPRIIPTSSNYELNRPSDANCKVSKELA